MVNLKSFENLKKLPKNSNIIIYPNSLLGIGLRRMLLKKRPDLKFICFFDENKLSLAHQKIISDLVLDFFVTNTSCEKAVYKSPQNALKPIKMNSIRSVD